MASPDFSTVGSEILRHHLGEGFVGEADVVEFAVDVEGGHVFLEVEGVGHVSGVEDEVEFEGVGFEPVFRRGDDEFFGAQFFGVGFFAGGVGKGVDFGAEGFGPEDAEVPETAAGEKVLEDVWRRLGGGSAALQGVTYTPRTATFFPGPTFARTRGLQVVIPAHIIGPASFESILSGIWKVKYSCALTWLE